MMAHDPHLVYDSQTVVMFPSSLYFLAESPCVRYILHRWSLSPRLASRLVTSQRAGSGMEDCLPSLHQPALEDAGRMVPDEGSALPRVVSML